MSWLRFLLDGADDHTMPHTWLNERLPEYEAYTRRQWDQGRIVTGTAEMARRAFWKAREHVQPRASVTDIRSKVKRA